MATETRSRCQGALRPVRSNRYNPQQNVRNKTALPLVRSGVALYLSLFDRLILTHPNEAVTEGGKLRPATRTAALIKQLKGITPHLAISGRTMEFDGKAKCVAGC